MTYRTLDGDHNFAAGTTGHTPSESAPLRHLRTRRRHLALYGYSGGVSLRGFGI